jgi:5-methyltetrahydropteroyltriglutamate--homocysteine methyltransferase
MKRSTAGRILPTHVGSIPRPESLRILWRSRLADRPVNSGELDREFRQAVSDVVQEQAACGIDIVADGEMGKPSFISYTDERFTGFTTMPPGDPNTPANNTAAF